MYEYAFALQDENGVLVDRALSVDDLHFRLVPSADVGNFNINEAFDVHFLVQDTKPYREFPQKGFNRDIAVCEREIRRQMKERYRDIGLKENGEAIEVTIDKLQDGGRYSGQVVYSDADFVVLENVREIISLHRKIKLDRVPSVGERASICYSGKKGDSAMNTVVLIVGLAMFVNLV